MNPRLLCSASSRRYRLLLAAFLLGMVWPGIAQAGVRPQPPVPAFLDLARDWRFQPDPDDAGRESGWFAPAFDSSVWTRLQAGKSWQDQGQDYRGAAWYRKRVRLPAAWRGKEIRITFGAADVEAELYLNGQLVMKWQGRLAPADVSRWLKPGAFNTIALRVAGQGKQGGLRGLPAELILANPDVPIGLSTALPVAGENVVITLHPQPARNARITVTAPDGRTRSLISDARGQARWQPKRYGRHILRTGANSLLVWVTARPLTFHWWDQAAFPRYATVVMLDAKTDASRAQAWKRRGAAVVAWACGEYCGRAEHGEKRLKAPEDWHNKWYARNPEIGLYDGIAIDELYASARPVDLAVSRALLLTRQAAGERFHIGLYCAGIDADSREGIENIRRSGVLLLMENYWGDAALFAERWRNAASRGLQDSTLLSLGPGFTLPDGRHGPLTEAELRGDFAKARRPAPEMRGMSFFNAYFHRSLDPAIDRAIEDYFLKPVIHLRSAGDRVEARNIGNEDARGFFVTFLTGDEARLKTAKLPVLRPDQSCRIPVPKGASRLRLHAPKGLVNLYEGGFDIEKNRNAALP
ncbi:MAG: hypothetical protein IT210_18120 [Armatimonadetes bacterium]|nr:hypothetical protein [Armatimonadota bacterium]